MRIWNTRASYFRQEARESIIDYRLCFDKKIVEAYPLSEPMSNLKNTRVYCVRLRACYRLHRLAQPYPNFSTLKARYEEINDNNMRRSGGDKSDSKNPKGNSFNNGFIFTKTKHAISTK